LHGGAAVVAVRARAPNTPAADLLGLIQLSNL